MFSERIKISRSKLLMVCGRPIQFKDSAPKVTSFTKENCAINN